MTVVGAHRPSAATVSRTLLAILASGPLRLLGPRDLPAARPTGWPTVARPAAGLRRRVALDCR
jgi:hypothetical protein